MVNKILSSSFGLFLIFALAFSISSIAKANSGEEESNTSNKVRICHRTNAVVYPYNSIWVNRSAVDGIGKNDHTHHTGPIFDPETMENGDDWGDIIPPHPGNSLNWPAGQAIWENDCEVPPVDLCTNLEGVQAEIPQGYEDPDQDKICTPVDLCNNLAGVQTSLLPGVVRLDDGSCISYGKSSPKPTITPTVLGTEAPAVGGTTESLPVSGGNDMSLYYLAIIAALGTTYYMKVAGWKKFVGNR